MSTVFERYDELVHSGQLRRDPFAMLPFCGYNMADHWGHWLRLGAGLAAQGVPLPAIFGVNWFRKGADGSYLWPGFGENVRVLAWALQRLDGSVQGIDSPLGVVPAGGELDLDGLDGPLDQLLAIDPEAWLAECDLTEEFFAQFGDRLPPAMTEELDALRTRLQSVEGAG